MEQSTVKKVIDFKGIGMHSGMPCTITVNPSPVNTGINFISDNFILPATVENIISSEFRTTIGVMGETISTTEHLLAAMHALGICNAIIRVSGNEIPILDGSSYIFFVELREHILRQGVKIPEFKLPEMRTKDATIISGDKLVIVYKDVEYIHSEFAFENQLAKSKTCIFWEDIPYLREHSLALGGNIYNSEVVISRISNLMIPHKILDLVGDLALLSMNLKGYIFADNLGHNLNKELMECLITKSQNP